MKSRLLIFSALLYSTATSAQQTTVQLECHDLSTSGSVVASDETLVNGMACKQVKQAPKQNLSAQAATPAPVAGQAHFAPTAASAPVASEAAAAPVAPATAASMKIVPGAKVYITPMDGFENYLVAAFGKKKVKLIPVADQNLADYVISGTSLDKKAGWAKIVFMGNIHSDNAASITMTDRHTGAIVYAYAVDKKSTMHGQQTTAEACAKHLEAHIEGKD